MPTAVEYLALADHWLICHIREATVGEVLEAIADADVVRSAHEAGQRIAELSDGLTDPQSGFVSVMRIAGSVGLVCCATCGRNAVWTVIDGCFVSGLLAADNRPYLDQALTRIRQGKPPGTVAQPKPTVDLADPRLNPTPCPDETLSPALVAALDTGDAYQVADVLRREGRRERQDMRDVIGTANTLLARHWARPGDPAFGGDNQGRTDLSQDDADKLSRDGGWQTGREDE